MITTTSILLCSDHVGTTLLLGHIDGSVFLEIAITIGDEAIEDLGSVFVVLGLFLLRREGLLELGDALGVFFCFPLPQLVSSVLLEDLRLGPPPLRARLECSPRCSLCGYTLIA